MSHLRPIMPQKRPKPRGRQHIFLGLPGSRPNQRVPATYAGRVALVLGRRSLLAQPPLDNGDVFTLPTGKGRSVRAPVRLPLELTELTATARVPGRASLDFASLAKRLTDSPRFAIRSDKKALRGVLSGRRVLDRGHGHTMITVGSTSTPHSIQIELFSGDHRGARRSYIDLPEFFEHVAEELRHPGRELSWLVGASFQLDAGKWRPVIPIPVRPDDAPQGAHIAGLDFAFSQDGDVPGLQRLFITTYDQSRTIVVRVLFTVRSIWDLKVLARAVELSEGYLRLFASKERQHVQQD